MKIAVLGGSFNPPHLGHLLIAKQVIDFGYTDEVWLTPCYRHTFLKDLAPVEDRVAMTKLLIQGSGVASEVTLQEADCGIYRRASQERRDHERQSLIKIKFCDEEIKNKLSGDTIELMEILVKKYPQHHFSFLVGSDNLSGFKRWGRWEELITKYDFLVYPRPGFEMDLSKYGLNNKNYKFKLINSPLLAKTDISSTLVRERIKNHLPITHLVPHLVLEYIKKNKLYL